jgi:hypothetical protein
MSDILGIVWLPWVEILSAAGTLRIIRLSWASILDRSGAAGEIRLLCVSVLNPASIQASLVPDRRECPSHLVIYFMDCLKGKVVSAIGGALNGLLPCNYLQSIARRGTDEALGAGDTTLTSTTGSPLKHGPRDMNAPSPIGVVILIPWVVGGNQAWD